MALLPRADCPAIYSLLRKIIKYTTLAGWQHRKMYVVLRSGSARVEAKIFVFACLRKFIFVSAKFILQKLTNNQNMLFSDHIDSFLAHCVSIFLTK
jgi:hypothetical protein